MIISFSTKYKVLVGGYYTCRNYGFKFAYAALNGKNYLSRLKYCKTQEKIKGFSINSFNVTKENI